MRNQNDNHNTFVSHKSRRPPNFTTEKYLQNYVPQQSMVPEIWSCASATKSKVEKSCLIKESQLKWINEESKCRI